MHITYIYFNKEKKIKKVSIKKVKKIKRETSYSLICETNSSCSSNYVVTSFQKSTDNLETRIKSRANLENR